MIIPIIHNRERQPVFLMAGYFFIVIFLIYVLKPVRNALFLHEMGAENLQYVYLGEGLFLIFLTAIYVWLSKKVSHLAFHLGILFFFFTSLLMFGPAFRSIPKETSILFYMWVASFSITLTTQFWSLANDLFHPEQGKRLFGVIISAGSLGGIAGGFMTQWALQWIRTEELLPLAACALLVCMALVFRIYHHISNDKTQPEEENTPHSKNSMLKTFLKSHYLQMLLGVVVISKMTSTWIDNEWNYAVDAMAMGKDDKTAFLAGFMGWQNTMTFVMQFVVTGALLRWVGLRASLWVLPLGILGFSISSFWVSGMLMAAGLKFWDSSVGYSIQQASKEILYLPLSRSLRRRLKPVIDMVGFRGAKSLAGLFLVVFTSLGLPENYRGEILMISAIVVWLWLVWKMRESYVSLLRSRLLSQKIDEKKESHIKTTDVLSYLYQEKDFEQVKQWIHDRSSVTRKLSAAACFSFFNHKKDLSYTRRLIQQLIQYEALDYRGREKFFSVSDWLPILPEELQNMQPTSEDMLTQALEQCSQKSFHQFIETLHQDLPADLKAWVLGICVKLERDETSLFLAEELSRMEHLGMRFSIMKTLHQLRKEKNIGFQRNLLKKEVLVEAALLRKLDKMLSFCKSSKEGIYSSWSYIQAQLTAMRDESAERMFQVLALLYPKEPVDALHSHIFHAKSNESAKSHAWEFLISFLDADLLTPFQLLWNDRSTPGLQEVKTFARECALAKDHWLSMAGFFLLHLLEGNISSLAVTELAG